jgi:hypothetical protein
LLEKHDNIIKSTGNGGYNLMDFKQGWDMLREAQYQQAIDYFLQQIQENEPDYAGYWGLGKAYLLTGQREQARQALEQAVRNAVENWDRGELPYDLVESMEKDLDRASEDAAGRMLNRARNYLWGLLNFTGAMRLDEALVEVEKAANFKLQPVKEVFVIELLQDSRFKVLQDQEIVALAEIPDPEHLLAAQQGYQVAGEHTLDDLAYGWRKNFRKEMERELQPILDSISGGNLKVQQVFSVMLKSRTFSEMLEKMEVLTRLYDLREVVNRWYKLLYQIWVVLPRWELGYRSLVEADIEDLWLGELTPQQIAAILDFDVDEEGNFYCRECGEKITLAHAHEH